MISMSRTAPGTLVLIGCVVALSGGCGGQPATEPQGPRTEPGQRNYLKEAIEHLRRAENPSDVRQALERVDRQLEQDSEGRATIKKRGASLIAIQDQLGLYPDEVEEITGSAFRPLDAHHVFLSLLLRDAAESLRIQGMPPLQQAERAFAWVNRQVVLKELREKLLFPPEAVLALGEGSCHERALVFLALLQQLDPALDGCMLAIPAEGSAAERYWIPAVLLPGSNQDELYLFDTRLGMPVPGPGGKGIATLRQAQKDPDVLAQLSLGQKDSYDVTPAEAARAEPRLVLPLSALAPRLGYLEELLAERDRLRLAMDPDRLQKRFEAAGAGKVGIWNQRGPTKSPPCTPTRALRLYLPREEGGADPISSRWLRQQREMFRASVVERNLMALGVFDELRTAKETQLRLVDLVQRLFDKYVVRSRRGMQRGLLDEAIKRLVRIEGVVQEFGQGDKTQLRQDAASWRMRLQNAYIGLARKQPEARRQIDALWAEDQYLLYLTDPSDEVDLPPKESWRALGFLIMEAAADPLQDDALFLLALAMQEKAEKQQAPRDTSAWVNAEAPAREYADQRPLGQEAIQERLQPLVAWWRSGNNNLEMGFTLWNAFLQDLRRLATGRLLQSRALEGQGKREEARQVLQRLVDALAAMRQDGDLAAAIQECSKRGQAMPGMQAEALRTRFAQLQRELRPGGSLHWLEQSARLRLSRVPKGS
jgi:hypothetical protein